MKKSKILVATLLPITAIAATAAIVSTSLTSCSSSNRLVPEIRKYDVALKTSKASSYAAEEPSVPSTQDRPTILPTDQNGQTPTVDNTEIDANFNKNPLEEIFKQITDNIKKFVSNDINDVILEFLSCMEQDNGINEIEILDKEDNGWKDVIQNVRLNGEFKLQEFLKDRKLPLLVDVLVEQENKATDKETRKLVQGVSLDLYIEFAGKAEVLEIVKRVSTSKPTGSNNNLETDYEDIMELLVGERKSNDPFDFDFDDIFERKDSSIDEIGLLKFMSNYNDITNSNAKMFGYTFDVNPFWESLANKANVKRIRTNTQKNTVFWAPSTSYCSLFEPQLNAGANMNTPVETIKREYDTYTKFDTALKAAVPASGSDYTNLTTFLDGFGIKLPNGATIQNATLSSKTDDFGSIKKSELKITDNFGNKYELEFYSNWWAKNKQ